MLPITRKIIDNFIRENKTIRDGYSLFIDDVSKLAQKNLIETLSRVDDSIESIILDYLQSLIDERLDLIYCEDRYTQGYKPVKDRINGETQWR